MTDATGEMDEAFAVKPIQRAQVLAALRDGVATRGELGSDLDVSKATLHRIVTFLRERELVAETDDGLALTGLGRVVEAEVAGYLERMETAHRLGPLLNGADFAAHDVDVDLGLFTGCEVTLPRPGQPQRPVRRLMELVEGSGELCAMGPVVLPMYVEVFHREIVDGMETDLVLEQTVVDGLQSEYAEQFTEAVETGRVAIRLHDDVPFGLAVSGEWAAVLGYSDDGVLRILVEDDSPAVVAWAEEVFERFREESELLVGG